MLNKYLDVREDVLAAIEKAKLLSLSSLQSFPMVCLIPKTLRLLFNAKSSFRTRSNSRDNRHY